MQPNHHHDAGAAAEADAKPSYLKEDLKPPSHPAKQAEAAEARPSYLREDLRPPTHPAKQAEARSTTAAASSSTPAAPQPSSTSTAAAGFPSGLPAGMDPDMLKQAAEMMKNNPGLAAQVWPVLLMRAERFSCIWLLLAGIHLVHTSS